VLFAARTPLGAGQAASDAWPQTRENAAILHGLGAPSARVHGLGAARQLKTDIDLSVVVLWTVAIALWYLLDQVKKADSIQAAL
jgi:hypothetical protein